MGEGYVFAGMCHSVHREIFPRMQTPQEGDPSPGPGGRPPQEAVLPPGGRPPPPMRETPPQEDPALQDQEADPQEADPPEPGGRPLPHTGMWSMGSRYASYWNAFLFPSTKYAQVTRTNPQESESHLGLVV